uniref:Uncharacterized protein n=1 Tax=Oryza barthii TaxID=65489 RepID=A0A0D3G4G3_9ORYZ
MAVLVVRNHWRWLYVAGVKKNNKEEREDAYWTRLTGVIGDFWHSEATKPGADADWDDEFSKS